MITILPNLIYSQQFPTRGALPGRQLQLITSESSKDLSLQSLPDTSFSHLFQIQKLCQFQPPFSNWAAMLSNECLLAFRRTLSFSDSPCTLLLPPTPPHPDAGNMHVSCGCGCDSSPHAFLLGCMGTSCHLLLL